MDACIAATAQVRELTLATRNQDDFAASVDDIVNPWSGVEHR
jgi:predicted nucleic acid-binding protein